MTSQFQNYVPVQSLPSPVGNIISVDERISESSQIIDPTSNTETISESAVVTVT